MIPQHEVSVVADGQRVPGWTNYQISSDMLQPADSFSLEVRFARAAWDLLQRDQLVTVYVDETPIVTGYIDERAKLPAPGGGGTMIHIRGRDKSGRLVDESCPLFSYGGLTLKDLAEKIVGVKDDTDPLFKQVTLVNTRNRSLLRRVHAPQARAYGEPFGLGGKLKAPPPVLVQPTVLRLSEGGDTFTARGVSSGKVAANVPRRTVLDPGIFTGRAAPKRVSPGQSRWAVLEEFLTEARLIAWSTADGEELFVGLPNYDQQNQFYFYEAAAETTARASSNCEIVVRESNAERYSMITCVGASAGDDADYGPNVKRRSTVYDNPDNTTDGTGLTFRRRKALIMSDDGVRSARDALERAERERLSRDSGELDVEVLAPGHGQRYRGDVVTLFAIDTMARVEDADTGLRGDFLVVGCDYTGGAGQPTQTRLRLVPRGTMLSL